MSQHPVRQGKVHLGRSSPHRLGSHLPPRQQPWRDRGEARQSGRALASPPGAGQRSCRRAASSPGLFAARGLSLWLSYQGRAALGAVHLRARLTCHVGFPVATLQAQAVAPGSSSQRTTHSPWSPTGTCPTGGAALSSSMLTHLPFLLTRTLLAPFGSPVQLFDPERLPANRLRLSGDGADLVSSGFAPLGECAHRRGRCPGGRGLHQAGSPLTHCSEGRGRCGRDRRWVPSPLPEMSNCPRRHAAGHGGHSAEPRPALAQACADENRSSIRPGHYAPGACPQAGAKGGP